MYGDRRDLLRNQDAPSDASISFAATKEAPSSSPFVEIRAVSADSSAVSSTGPSNSRSFFKAEKRPSRSGSEGKRGFFSQGAVGTSGKAASAASAAFAGVGGGVDVLESAEDSTTVSATDSRHPPPCSAFHPSGTALGGSAVGEMFRRGVSPQGSLSKRFLAARRSNSAGGPPPRPSRAKRTALGQEEDAPSRTASAQREQDGEREGDSEGSWSLPSSRASCLRPSRTEADIVSAFEQRQRAPPLLPLLPSPPRSTSRSPRQKEESGCASPQRKIREALGGSCSGRTKATFVVDRSPITRGSFLRLIMKQFPSQPIPLHAICLRKAFNGYLLEDNTGELGIGRLPFFEGVLNTWSAFSSSWVSRYFVLHRGHWFWFETKSCYERGGLESCSGSVSLLINEFAIDLDPKYVTRFSLTLRDWGCVVIDTGVQEQDRGAWVIHFLAYKNKGDQLRERFPEVDWEELCVRSRLAIPAP